MSTQLDSILSTAEERASARTANAEKEALQEKERAKGQIVVEKRLNAHAFRANSPGTLSFTVDDGTHVVTVDNCIDGGDAVRCKCIAMNQDPSNFRHRVKPTTPPAKPKGQSSGKQPSNKDRQPADASGSA